jgi:hypothetical protein
MTKEIMIPILKAVGVIDWLNAGFKGQTIKVWNIEENFGHGANTRQMIIDVAPEVDVISASFGVITEGDKLLGIPTTSKGVEVKDFVDLEKPHIITSSQGGQGSCKEWEDYVTEFQNRLHMPIFNSAGNDGLGDGETIGGRFPPKNSIIIGALSFINGSFSRASYSSVGEELDFIQSIGWWSGTSASTPFQAGMCAIIMSRYGFMSNEEMYKYLKFISKDYAETGHDNYYGWGQPILPALSKKYITMTVGSEAFRCDGKNLLMDTSPVNKEGNVFVPVRAIAESLGYEVIWNSPNIEIGGKVKLTIGSNIMFVDGKKVFLNFAPYIDENNRTLVPIRAIAEAFGCKVDWVQSEKKVMILEV